MSFVDCEKESISFNMKASIANLAFSTSSIIHQTINPTASSFNFLVLGDWGRSSTKTVAKAMQRIAKNDETEFIIALGDNYYAEGKMFKDGVSGVNDERWRTLWYDVYAKDSLSRTPWYAVLGNHDHLGNAKAQIEV